VLGRSEYTWRLPREEPPEDYEEPGLISQVLDWITKEVKSAFKAIGRFFRKIGRWIDDLIPDRDPKPYEKSQTDWAHWLRVALWGGITLLASVLAVVLYRFIKNRSWSRPSAVTAVAAKPAPPDLTDENLTADERPVDDWLALARDMAGKGEYRLALRALYLATLARLAEFQMIVLARYKSNREYERELARHAPDEPGIPARFQGGARLFDRTWYGRHAAGPEELDEYEKNLDELLTLVSQRFGRPASAPSLPPPRFLPRSGEPSAMGPLPTPGRPAAGMASPPDKGA
jgi:hypothetical protein